MSWQAQPTIAGTYRIKISGTQDGRYWRYIPDDDRQIHLQNVDESSQFKWRVAPVSGKSNIFTIQPVYDLSIGMTTSTTNKHEDSGYVFLQGQQGASVEWKIRKSSDGAYSKISLEDGSYVADCQETPSSHVYFNQDQDLLASQRWVFQLANDSPSSDSGTAKSFEKFWFTLSPEKAATESYDIIIIGTGMGGGVIAGDLFNTNSRLGGGAKSVLVIEKGGLTFHSHCLNGARPSGLNEDRGQQNDTFFALFKNDYTFEDPKQVDEWKGGPMFNLGGRGAAWGLFIPRIYDETIREQFGHTIYQALVQTWYKEAENLMDFYLPTTNAIHAHLLERLNVSTQRDCQWQWGRIASEFSDPKNFDFAAGAYSPIDKLLEIAMSKGKKSDGSYTEHENFKILLNTDVRRITWDESLKTATGVVVRDINGVETAIKLKVDPRTRRPLDGTAIVVGAGSVGSPAILMRSGMEQYLRNNNGLHLTDHDIFSNTQTFRYLDPSVRKKVGSMKIQSYVRLKSNKVALANVAIDASSFLPREYLPDQFFTNEDYPQLITAFIMPAPLNQDNNITLDKITQEPIVSAGRYPPFSNDDPEVVELRELTEDVIRTTQQVLGIQLRSNDSHDNNQDSKFFEVLQLGGVAHELGTIPFKGVGSATTSGFCLDDNLKLRNRSNVYVCDLSIFPYSPQVNPTLTLVALALRLSRHLLPAVPVRSTDEDTIYVMNQTGEPIKVIVSNVKDITLTRQEIDNNKAGGGIVGAGEIVARKRASGVTESAMVYRLDYNSKNVYLTEPRVYIANAGATTVVQ